MISDDEKVENAAIGDEFRFLIMRRLYSLAHMINEDENFKYRMRPQEQVERSRQELEDIQSIINDYILCSKDYVKGHKLPNTVLENKLLKTWHIHEHELNKIGYKYKEQAPEYGNCAERWSCAHHMLITSNTSDDPVNGWRVVLGVEPEEKKDR